jgi:excisionase family DNA binding protein
VGKKPEVTSKPGELLAGPRRGMEPRERASGKRIAIGGAYMEKVGPLLLTSRQAAEALAISERKLWDLTKRGDIPVVRIGRSVRYAPADLQAWIESKTKRAGAAASARPTG